MIQTKQTATIGMAMHIGTSKHYARVIYRLAKKFKRLDKKDDGILKEFEEGIEDKSIKIVVEKAMEFIDIEEKEHEYEATIDKDGFMLEYRVVKDLGKLLDELEDIEKKQEGKSKEALDAGIKKLKEIFSEIKKFVEAEVKLERDQELGHHFLRDQDMRGENWLERILKREARHLKGDINPTKRVLHEVHNLIQDIKKGHVDENLLKKLAKELDELKKDIKEEFKEIFELEKIMAHLSEKNQRIMKKFDADLAKLKTTHFPEHQLEEIEAKVAKLESHIKELEKDNLITAKAVRNKVRRDT